MFSGLLLAMASSTALAADPNADDAAIDNIVVEATKIPTAGIDIAGSVTLIDDRRIEQALMQSIQDLVRYEPGIDIADQGSRFGFGGISIRGIGGNRVKVEVDGVATSDAFSIGSFSNAGRDFVDVDSLKQVEIVRGPASAMFGSNALGGVVSFVTKGPQDLLGDANTYADVSAGFNSVDDSSLLRATGAVRSGNVAGMIRAGLRQGSERDLTLADPLDDDSLNVLARIEFGENGNGALDLSLEHFTADSDTQVDSLERRQDFSAGFGFPYIIDTTEVAGDDSRERSRISLGQKWLNGRFGTDYLRWRAYRQESETLQRTFEARESFIAGVASAVTREREFRFDQELTGLEINAGSDFETGRISHQLAYGFEIEETDTAQIRDGLQTDLSTGETSPQVGPDLFPVRDFPLSSTTGTGVYLQNRMSIGAVSVIPGIRWDRYELDPQPDAIFAADNPGITPVALDDEQFSPKLGVLWRIDERWTAFAQYAEGFRAPPVNDVNVGFTNFQFGYTALPNPDLKSESSEGYEVGVRYAGEQMAWEIVAFDTRYDDFIESFSAVGFDPVNNLLLFQSINIDKVRIDGVEFKGRFRLPYFSEQLSLSVAAAYRQRPRPAGQGRR